ncbi:MAG TPA: glycosyltransferase family 4 protein [Rhodanobacteraceae bacterium]
MGSLVDPLAILCAAAFVLSWLLTWMAILYAHRRGMLDQPGFRRSHAIPTPRGGGIGLVIGTVLAMIVALAIWPGGVNAAVAVAVCVAALVVAMTGWLDDHRALPVLPRLMMQVLASVLFMAVLLHARAIAWAWLPVWLVLAVWSINLHNFMDGIDGILGLQVLFVGAGLAVLAWHVGQPVVAIVAASMAAASCGFLVFNWPPARIFMGDVGSGFAGFTIFVLIALLFTRVRLTLWPALLLCSGFVADAGFTLAWRMWCGKRWYTAHREHLYQWLVRCGWTHAGTGGLYMLWNVLLATPLAVWAVACPYAGPWLCLGLYAVAAGVWCFARHACIGRLRSRGRWHAA